MGCAEDVFTKLERCTNDQEKQDLNVTRKVIDAGIDFVCHNDGDRIACKYIFVFCCFNVPSPSVLCLQILLFC